MPIPISAPATPTRSPALEETLAESVSPRAPPPEWRSDGRELYFIDAEGKLVAAPVIGAESFEAGVPTVLFDLHAPPNEYPGPMPYAAIAGGQNVFGNRLIDREPLTSLVVVLNWTAALKK